jgi:uncharacterized protein
MTRSSNDRSIRAHPWSCAGATLHPGSAAGRILKLSVPLSFWGGASHSGRIIDRHHPQYGQDMSGRVLAMTSGRGSSSSSSVLAELLRAGFGPAAILLTEPDAIVALGAIVAAELYDVQTPVVMLTPGDFASIPPGASVEVRARPGGAEVLARAEANLPR